MRSSARLLTGTAARPAPAATHQVLNQSALFYGNAFTGDAAVHSAVNHFLSSSSSDAPQYQRVVSDYGAWAGAEATAKLARTANEYIPKLKQFDRNGRRIDVVEYCSAYHDVYSHATKHQVPSFAWNNRNMGSHVVRAALNMIHYQAESGTSCPLTMTFAAIPALAPYAPAFGEWITKGCAPAYNPDNAPISEKSGVVFGMSMTEKAGGSDVRANTTTARPVSASSAANSEPGAEYALTGHKWFTSAPMSDAFLTLAYVPSVSGDKTSQALSCFLVPRWLNDGTRNSGFRIMRLKDKLGDRSNASSEVEYDNAVGYLLGPLGRGVPTILEMVVHTRLDCTLGSAGLMRQAVRNAAYYCRHRSAFGMTLTDAPMMQVVLSDLAVESEAAVWLALSMAHVFDLSVASPGDADLQAFRRLSVAAAKYFNCKQAPSVVYEAMESVGGIGYVEEWDFARWYRQAPLNSIWEGSGNVIALDILRTVQKEPRALSAFLTRTGRCRGLHPLFDAHLDAIGALISFIGSTPASHFARYLAEMLALTLQGDAMAFAIQSGHSDVAPVFDFWCQTRIGNGGRHRTFGALPPSSQAIRTVPAIMDRLLQPML